MEKLDRYHCQVSSIASANVEFVHYARKTYFHVIDQTPNMCIEVSIRDKKLNQLVGIYRTEKMDRHETYAFIEEKVREYEEKL